MINKNRRYIDHIYTVIRFPSIKVSVPISAMHAHIQDKGSPSHCRGLPALPHPPFLPLSPSTSPPLSSSTASSVVGRYSGLISMHCKASATTRPSSREAKPTIQQLLNRHPSVHSCEQPDTEAMHAAALGDLPIHGVFRCKVAYIAIHSRRVHSSRLQLCDSVISNSSIEPRSTLPHGECEGHCYNEDTVR